MSHQFPRIFLARHGETLWSMSGQHTGRTEIPLTQQGELDAKSLGVRLKGIDFRAVFTSPLQRAKKTCELAGFAGVAHDDSDLLEWNYGDYEGKTRSWIVEQQPAWVVFRDGCPGGESPEEIRTRADRVVSRLRSLDGDVLLFSHGHFLRVLATAWLGSPTIDGRRLMLTTASVSILSYDHDLSEPAIVLWNDNNHLRQ
jgi:probable phosphoglycerate mutase